MFCMNCGKPLPDGSRFCPHCGTPVPKAKDATEGPSLDDLIQKVKEKQEKEERIHPLFCSPEDDSEALRPYHDGKGASMLLTWTAAILNTMSGRWDFSVCLRL